MVVVMEEIFHFKFGEFDGKNFKTLFKFMEMTLASFHGWIAMLWE